MASSSTRSIVSDSRRCAPVESSTSEPSTSPILRRQVLMLLRSPQFARGSLLSLMLACMGTPQNVSANPLNGTVAAGDATIVTATPNRLDIVQSSDRAIINWQGFSIAQGELTNFQQPGTSSVTLNRVTGNQASAIAGTLTANGTVMLVNPNGIVIGKTGVVDVSGLVATTANIEDDDFLAQRLNFNQASTNPNAKVVNEGRITIGNQGLAALVAPTVKNAGVIEARLGKVALGAGQTFSLDFQGDGLLSFSAGSAVATTPHDENGAPVEALVENTGRIGASGGTVQLTATAVKDVVDNVINTSGLVEARSVGMQNGAIVLSGNANGTIAVAGTLDVSGDTGQGGAVRINGERIAITGDALIDASGTTGGGTIDIGHDGADLASAVRIDRGTHIRADATFQGDGGNIIVLSSGSTSFAGSISARGGASGGDGGFVEVSSRDRLGLSGSVDLNAPQGATGNLLLDPATLTITDTPSGGSQDGAAGDGTIVAGDPNIASNSISRGTLEALSGSTNLTLEATGLITIESMGSGVINLQTDASHSFTLRSTTTGGIDFVDPNTEIVTQGGDITLQALKTGALTNIGQLTSNGGDITLVAGGLVQLGGVLDAGAGNVAVTSLSNSIQRVGPSNLIGDSVTLSAAYGSVGAAGNVMNTSTGRLTLATGGNLFVADDTALSQLSVTSVHAVATPFLFEVSAPQLSFDVTDDGARYLLTSIANATGLDLTFSGDRDIVVGDVHAATGHVALGTRSGSLLDDGDTATGIVGAGLTLTSTGAIGATGASLTSSVATLAATTGSGGVNLDNMGTLDVSSLTAAGGTSAIASTGDILMHSVAAAGATLSLTSTAGSVFTAGGPNDTIAAQTLNLNGAGAIGTVGTPVRTTATTVNATAASGIYAATTGSTALGTVISASGPISIAAGGNIAVDRVDASPAGAVSLTATNGSITASTGGTNVVANTFDFASTASFGSVSLGVAATTIAGTAGFGGINLTQTGAATLSNVATTGQLAVNSTAGNVVLGALNATNATIDAAAGDILDDGNAATALVANAVTLTADAGSLGTSVLALDTSTPSLTLASTGNIFVDSAKALSTLNITNTHPTPGVANTLIVSAPYLQFDVTDTGSQFLLADITGLSLNTLSFTGDQTSTLTKLHAAGSVSVRALQGDLLDDGNENTRLTGSSISLAADHGSLGTSAATGALETNTSSLTARTGGNLFINDIADLSGLSVFSMHEAAAQDYQYVLTAPSLRFDLTDSSSGYALTNVSDTTSLGFTFEGDRTITAGSIDVTRSGNVTLRATAGSVLDDGDKSTQILGDSVSLGSTLGDVGSTTGNGYMDVITRQLSGNTPAGSFTVALPYSANTVNSNGAVTISGITAAGPVAVTVDNGDLRVSSLNGGDAVTLTTSNGSILSSSFLHATDLTLSASGSIGVTTAPLQTQVQGSITATAAGGGFYLSNSGAIDLLTASAAGPITVTGTGDIIAGAIGAGANAVVVTAGNGLLDDGSAATRVVGSSVALTAQSGTLGAASEVIGVTTPSLALASGNDVYVDDSVGVSALSIAGTSDSAFNTNIYSVVAPGLTFSATDDGGTVSLDSVDNTAPLAFEFSTQRTLNVGAVDTDGGSATLASVQGSVLDDGDVSTTIGSPTLAISAGNSIGASGIGNALAIDATALTLTALGDFYIDDSAALNSLVLTSTAFAGQTNNFGIAAAGQTFTLSDDGSTHYLQTVTGAGLGAFSFTGKKNLELGTIDATGAVALATSGGNSSIVMDGVGGSRVSGGSVALSTLGSSGGNIGTSGTSIAVGTSALSLGSPGNIYVSDNQALASLAIKQTHGSTANYTTSVAASGLTFSLTDGATANLGNIVSSGMNFSYDTDRVVQVGTINVGGAGAVTLVGAGTYQTQAIQDDGNQGTRITAGTVNIGSGPNQGYVGSGSNGDIDVTTANLVVKSTGDIYVSNSTALASLAVTASHSNSGDRTYAIAASGLTFSVADQSLIGTGGQGTVINNVSNAGLDFSFASDRTLQVVTLNTGGAGRVTLTSNNIVDDNNDGTRITANTLTLNGSTAGESSTGILKELDATVSVLNTSLTSQLYLINTGNLTLGENSVANNATITSLNGSFFSNGLDAFATRSLSLTANNGSLGTNVAPLLLNARSLALRSGYDMFASSLVDLVSLNVTNNHTAVRTNTLSVVAPNLTFDIDDIGGTQFDLVQVTDSTGIDFTFAGDKEIRLGAVDVKGGNYLSLTSSADIFDDGDGATELTGENVYLNAGGSIGRVDPVEVNTTNLQLRMGGDINVHDNLDLTSLNLEMAGQAGVPTYVLTAPSLSFDVTDDGTTTTVHDVTDSDGLNFTLRTVHSQAVQVIDTQRYGTVSLFSSGSIAGSGVSTDRITAASSYFETLGGGDIGVLANPILLSSPLVSMRSTGDIYIDSDTHIDRLSIVNAHGNAGTYSILSPDLTFNVTDTAGVVSLASIVDTTGLNLSYSADQDFQLGTINLGTAGNLSLSSTTGGVDFAGDGNVNTLISAVGVNISTTSGAIGTAGAGNELNIAAQNFTGNAGGGGVRLDFRGAITINSINSNGASELVNAGDIAIGSFDANGQSLAVTAGGSILSGSISESSNLTLTAGGGIGTVSRIQTNANGGTTTLNASAAAGGVSLNEAYTLNVSNLTATEAVDLTSRFGTSVGTIDSSGGPVTLTTSEGSFTGTSGANLITGTAVTLNANYSQSAQSIGASGTRLRVDTPELTLNARGNFYVTDLADLSSLTMRRSASSTGSPGGAISVIAPSLTFNASDNGSTMTLTNITDTTGLNFALTSYSAIAVNTLNVGTLSDVSLTSARYNTDGTINSTGGTPLLTARSLSLATSGGSNGSIGTSGTPLRTSVATLAATAQNGGIYVSQSGALTLNNVNSGGALSVTTTSGNLTVGSVSYGNNQPLTLTASAASLLDDGVNSTSLLGVGTGAINLSAANGIGTSLSPFTITDQSTNNINATVTGAGSAYLDITSSANPLVSITAANGSIDVITGGLVTLANLVSTTDAVGNDISATTRSGNLGLGIVTAGALHGSLDLSAPTGSITALNSSNAISAFDPNLSALNGIGTFAAPLNVTGQSIVADTVNGGVYLSPTGVAVLGFVRSQNGTVNVNSTSDVVAANVLSGAGGVTLSTSGAGSTIYTGNINAGSGGVALTATNGRIVDDGVSLTSVRGGAGNFTAANFIGTSSTPIATRLTSLTANVSGNGGIYIDQTGALALSNLTSGGGAISVVGTDSLTGSGAINANGAPVTLTAGNAVALTGSINTVGVDPNLATVTISGDSIAVNNVTSTGAQQYDTETTVTGSLSGLSLLIDGQLTLGGAGTRTLTTNAAGQSIVIDGDVDGAGLGLSLSAGGGAISIAGDATNLASFASNSNLTTVGRVATVGAQSYTGNTVFNGSAYTTNGGAFTAAGPAVFGADSSVATNSGTVLFASTVNGAHALTIDAGAGNATFGGAIGGVTPLTAVVVNSGGLTTFGGAVAASSLITDAPGTLSIVPTTITTSGAQSYGEAFTLGNDMTFTGTSVTFGGAVNGTTPGQEDLTVVGAAVFNGGAGATVALQTIAVSGAAGVSGTMATTNAQTYGGAISLVGDTVFTLGNGLAFNSTIDGAHAMTVNAGASNVTFNQAIGGTTRVGDVVINSTGATTVNGAVTAATFATNAAGSTLLNATAVSTTGAQSYGDAVVVGSDVTLTGSNIAMRSTLNDSSAGTHAVTIAGDATLDGAVGATTALRSLSVSGAGAVNGGAVTTTASQSYGSLALGADTALTGTLISSGTVDGATAGQQVLEVVGNAVFSGNIGSTRVLESIEVGGTTRLGGNVTTSGIQTYTGAVTAQNSVVLASNGGDVTFGSTVDGGQAPSAQLSSARALSAPTINGGQALTVNAGTGEVTFDGAVGGTSRLGDVRVNTAGATVFNAPVYAASVATDVPGTVALNGGLVDTSGTQTYGEIVTLGADTVLSGTTVNFVQAVDSDAPGQRSITINGAAVFDQAVGSTAALRSLAVTGASALNGGKVITTGSQSYTGATTVGVDTTLTSGGSVSFGSTLDAVNLASLDVTAPAGSIAFSGAIGGIGPFDNFVILAGQDATFGGAVKVNDFDAGAGAGTMTFNGPLTAATGDIRIDNSQGGSVVFAAASPVGAATGFVVSGTGGVQLASDVTVGAGPISVAGLLTLIGPRIAMQTDGDMAFTGISGPGTILTVAAGSGTIAAGSPTGGSEKQVILRDMVVDTALSAQLYGSLSNIGGGGTAKFVKSTLFGPPYYFNDVPFGPLEFVDRLVAQQARKDATAGEHLTRMTDERNTGDYPEQSPLDTMRAPVSPEVLKVEPAQYRCLQQRNCEIRVLGR